MKMDFDINRKKKKEEKERTMYEEEQIRQENVKEGVVYTLSEDEYQELEWAMLTSVLFVLVSLDKQIIKIYNVNRE